MRDIIKNILKEEYRKMTTIPDSTVLSIYNDSLTIINIDDDDVLAFISLSEGKDSYYFPMIAAEKGYGPTILDSSTSESPLIQSFLTSFLISSVTSFHIVNGCSINFHPLGFSDGYPK